MSDWTAGYVADIDYTYGYYGELNPTRAKMAILNKGLVCPQFTTACELGFGQGVSTNFHAAASVTRWFGTDFNPAQAGFAKELAAVADSGAQLYDEAFADFANRSDLPDFDYIGLHGIWSWISDENRQVIVDFIGRKLKVGGVLYISYNTLPGWTSFVPMRHLLKEHAETIGATGHGTVSRVNAALEFATKLLATNPLFLRANPQVAERITKLKEQNRNYLAHEYFNDDWHPMQFETLAKWLAPAKLQFACSANYLDHLDGINLNPEQQAFIKELPDAMLRESVRDFMVNQQFRRDYWIKGARKLSSLEQVEQIREQKFILTSPRESVSLKVTGALGSGDMNTEVYNPILDCFTDHKPKSLLQVEQAIKEKGIKFTQIQEAVVVLVGGGHLSAVQDEAITAKAKARTTKLNSLLLRKSRDSGDHHYLVSPVTGAGIGVGRFQQLFLLALTNGKKQPAEWAEYAWQMLALQNQKLVKDKITLETPEANIAELTNQANTFAEKVLPILKALQIA